MPLNTRMVGCQTESIVHDIDARWIMAYAAGIGDFNVKYMDTANHEILAHPVFPVCLEWPVVLASRHLPGYESMTPEESRRGVHASHDLHIYRPIRAGDRLWTQATVASLSKIKPGAAVWTRLDTRDEHGDLVCQTYQLGISRGVSVTGPPTDCGVRPPALPKSPSDDVIGTYDIAVPEGMAHVYTECARIWNPIHTDRAVALAAGLPDVILHGTATLAVAVSRLINEFLEGDPTRVKRLGGRFLAMVMMPSTLALRVFNRREDTLFFSLATENGDIAFGDGFLRFE